MSARTETKPWDFSQALDVGNLLNNLSIATLVGEEKTNSTPRKPTTPHTPHTSQLNTPTIATKDFATGLGDFSKVWQILGTPSPSAGPVHLLETNAAHTSLYSLPSKDDYASDGATYYKTKPGRGSASVIFDDPPSPDIGPADSITDGSDSTSLTKAEKATKAERKRLKKARQKAKKVARQEKSATVSESEAVKTSKKTPARKASVHNVVAETPPPRYNLPDRYVTPKLPADTLLPNSIKIAYERVAQAAHNRQKSDSKAETPTVVSASPAPHADGRSSVKWKVPVEQISPSQPREMSFEAQHHPKFPHRHAQATQFLPSSVKPPQLSLEEALIQPQPFKRDFQVQPAIHIGGKAGCGRRPVIEPIIIRSGTDRSWALLMKLINDFYEDRGHLVAPANLTTHNNDPNGIHIFVDASNIFIGFNEQLKRARNIPSNTSMPLSNLSFDALALLMERRRPVAKRVLVGSNPHLPAFDKAKAVGYECNILDKVYKARELTERQIYFKEQEERHRTRGRNGSAKALSATPIAHSSPGQGSGSGSETTAPQFAPARMIEQGVDEILHLKILESIVDTDTPSTIVLATGDAAQAEYSKGFMAMVERALKKGWKVELVSWSANISMMYQKPLWKQTWGDQFKIVFLDDYAEELLDM